MAGPLSSLLLPRPARGWLKGVLEEQARQHATYANAHGIGVDAYRRAIEGSLRSYLLHADVRVRVTLDVLRSFLQSGRYWNLFQAGTSTGAFVPGRRMMVEAMVFGIPSDARAADRPIYGYLEGSIESAPTLTQYGKIVLRMSKAVRRRSTFTFGDSLDDTAITSVHPPYAPAPVVRPAIYASHSMRDIYGTSALAECLDPRYMYAEAQIFGGITPRDVEEVVFLQGIQPDRPLVDDLNRWGVLWRTVAGSDP
jgi:hypothetical protein